MARTPKGYQKPIAGRQEKLLKRVHENQGRRGVRAGQVVQMYQEEDDSDGPPPLASDDDSKSGDDKNTYEGAGDPGQPASRLKSS